MSEGARAATNPGRTHDAGDSRTPTPRVSIVIPVYNEEGILSAAVVELVQKLEEFPYPYEVILAENGSRDRTVEIARQLATRHPQVRLMSLGEPNYGKALRLGILDARGEFVVCDEIDLCDTDFHLRAIGLLESNQADLVIGSKLVAGAEDRRPASRHAASIVINWMLRIALGFHGTDTHGLKAMRKAALVDTIQSCLVDRDLFASEMVIRAERGGIRIREIPVRVVEKREPSIRLTKRVPNVLKNMARLFWAIRVRG
jgi:glycosyltransferase involved in cell wall biosynthesis